MPKSNADQTVYKYPIDRTDKQVVQMPLYAQVLSAAIDPRGVLCIWAQVCLSNPMAPVTVWVVGTGDPMPKGMQGAQARFVATVVDGSFVWHVYTS